jgi:hypothetical protein
MSNIGSVGRQSNPRLPTPPRGEVIARYDTYLEAQQAVDFLSDEHFPVQAVTIVGSGLRMVERVTGRLSYPRVALAGAASGAWFGLFVGVLLSLFGSGTESVLFAAVMFGSGFGMLFGVISYAFTGGRRDFTSTSQIVASEYEVWCLPEYSGQASELLNRSPAGLGHPEEHRTPTVVGGNGRSDGSDPAGTSVPTRVDPATMPPPSGPAVSHTPPWGTEQPEPSKEPQEPQPEPEPDPDAGLTYGEAMERRRRAERERQEREQADRDGAGEDG